MRPPGRGTLGIAVWGSLCGALLLPGCAGLSLQDTTPTPSAAVGLPAAAQASMKPEGPARIAERETPAESPAAARGKVDRQTEQDSPLADPDSSSPAASKVAPAPLPPRVPPPLGEPELLEGETPREEWESPFGPAPLPRSDHAEAEFPLDFGTALALTQGQSPRIAFAQARIVHAYAQYEAARVAWLPHLRAGVNYNRHEGRIQDVVGENIETSRGASYGGLGASAVGAGSPAIPGIAMRFHLADALHQPRIQAEGLAARRFESTAAVNDALLDTSLAYLQLLAAHQQLAIAADAHENARDLASLTAEFARTGAGTEADADRASAAVALLRNELARGEEGVLTASARLAQQLSVDPSVVITPGEATLAPIDLVELEQPLPLLVATGLSNRPELSAQRALVREAGGRLRREEQAVWLPSLALGVSYGAFGAGRGRDLSNAADRFDLDAAAWWEVRNLGFGDVAARDAARAQIQAARMREVQTLDEVAREIAEAHAQSRARRRQIEIARQGVEAAQDSYRRNLERIRNGEGLPIEVLQAIQALDAARRDYLRALLDYNTAQFRLQRALGWPIGEA